MGWWYGYRPYVPVAQRRAKAAKHAAKLAKGGHRVSPVMVAGRKIATTFWGKAWCENLESYSDYANRLPRGRTYVCNGSVVDLQIKPGVVKAIVSGSEIYDVEIAIDPLPEKTWKAIKRECVGQIASLIELLQGKLSRGVMEIITRRNGGLFPTPKEIKLSCSCPDYAYMCKHVAAALYGVGSRLDEQPELLFVLRKVDHLELIEQAGNVQPALAAGKSGKKTIASGDLADVFGIELDGAAEAAPMAPAAKAKPARKRSKIAGTVPAAATAPAKPTRRGVQATKLAKPLRRAGKAVARSKP
jgi:uncharacterized Zn finger protein